MALSVCFVFTITIGIFPAVTVEVRSSAAKGGAWGKSDFLKVCLLKIPLLIVLSCHRLPVSLVFLEKYFIPVFCFLLFNLMDWAGRSLTAKCTWVSTKRTSGKLPPAPLLHPHTPGLYILL